MKTIRLLFALCLCAPLTAQITVSAGTEYTGDSNPVQDLLVTASDTGYTILMQESNHRIVREFSAGHALISGTSSQSFYNKKPFYPGEYLHGEWQTSINFSKPEGQVSLRGTIN